MKIVRYYEKPAFRTGIISQATIFTKQSLMELQAKFYKVPVPKRDIGLEWTRIVCRVNP